MSNTDTKINIVVTSTANTDGITRMQGALDDLQQTASHTGTIGMDASPEQVKTVEDTTAAYEDLAKQIADVKQELQQQAKAHKTTRAAAEQSAGGIVGAYRRAKAAVMTVKGAINSVMWWMAAANQAVELVGKVWDVVTAKSRAAKEAAAQQAAAEEESFKRIKALEQAVYDELAARKQAAREMEQARVNRTYEDRIKYIERAMELEAVLAQIAAAKTNDQYAIAQAQLQRDLATQAITQAQYDEQSRQLEVDHNEALRKQAEQAAAEAVNAAKEQERINREAYEAQMLRLRKLKEAAGTVYHDYNIMGQRFSVGVDPAKLKIMKTSEFNDAANKANKANRDRGDASVEIEKAQKALDYQKAIRNSRPVQDALPKYGEDYLKGGDGSLKKIKEAEDALAEQQRILGEANAAYNKYSTVVRDHKDALVALGFANWKDADPAKWTKGTDQYYSETDKLANTSESAGSVSAALKTLKTSTDEVTNKQNAQTAVIEINNSARERDAELTAKQREGRGAEQSRAAEQQASAARIGAAQVAVDQLSRTAEQQQQAAKAQQEVIDKMVSGTADKNFQTFLDRMATTIAQQSNEGGYRDRLQQALEMFKGYATASPDQLAGKMDEMTEVFKRVTLPYSMMGSQDIASLSQMMEALLAKANLGTQMRGTAQQQQAAGNNLTEVRDAETSIATANEHEQTQRAAITAVATAARALRERITDPQQQDDLDTIIEVMHDGQVAADETSILVNAFGSLADANREAADSLVSGLSTAVKSGEGFLAFARESLGKTAEGAAAMQRQEAEITALRGSMAHIKWSSGTLP